MRIFALSDIHIDYQENLRWVEAISDTDYVRDVLILAGDVSHDRDLCAQALECVRRKFARVFFVPGNHDLWLRSDESGDSLQKCTELLDRCRQLDVHTQPRCLTDTSTRIWIVPLFAWYVRPEEDPHESLFVPKQGEDPHLGMWVDNRAIRWPSFDGFKTAAAYFLAQNQDLPQTDDTAVVISFSHFVPRPELIFPTFAELESLGIVPVDPQPRFNFSRVAGCHSLECLIRQLRSQVHIYGHQHRNRQRHIDGITYLSHCLGYPRERAHGKIPKNLQQPLLVWDTDAGGRVLSCSGGER
ncbi:MAG: metallophosphoesterase [Desulfobacterota bacterium]|nr:metallophosphoesterase [Thermodesulfobacteriota bacterium]